MIDPGLPELLDGVVLVRGNQEERIARHVAPSTVPGHLRRLLEASQRETGTVATYDHGHRLAWREIAGDHWCPVGLRPETTVHVFGHHHRTALYEQGPDSELPRELPLTSGVPVRLDPDRRYLVNLGPARTTTPAWAILQEDTLTLTAVFTWRRHRERDYA